jgi:hypothetical protein
MNCTVCDWTITTKKKKKKYCREATACKPFICLTQDATEFSASAIQKNKREAGT